MSVNLQKGQKIDLTKGSAGLKRIMVGLGWDAAAQKKKGLFSSFLGSSAPDIDCDASVLMLRENEKLGGKGDIIYFGNLRHSSQAVIHQGDNLTGDGDGDDEQIMISLDKVPQHCEKLLFVVNIYQAMQRKQHFGMIENAFIRLVNADNNSEICKYNLSENYENMTAMIMGEVYRYQGEWKFNAIGQATQDAGLQDIVKRYTIR